jgi:hypothetical protein
MLRAKPCVLLTRKPNKEYNSRTPLIRTLVVRIADCQDFLGISAKVVENSTQLTCPEISGYQIKRSKGSYCF